MHWRNVFILTGVLMVAQAGLQRLIGLGPQHIMPDLLLGTAVVLAFRGADERILPVCWWLGLAKDMITDAPLGSYALAFGLMGLMLVWVRELLYRDHTLGLMLVTLLSALGVEQMVFGICLWRGRIGAGQWGNVSWAVFFGAVFTAALVPYTQWVLVRLRYWLGWSLRKSFYGR